MCSLVQKYYNLLIETRSGTGIVIMWFDIYKNFSAFFQNFNVETLFKKSTSLITVFCET